ncbi:MAG: DUF5688 family protein [Lachnospiraceae bacterium]|jgi:hypothetical protein|nr:DUF5688 family protein [Lachnospiraceae bacterium]
MEYANFLVAIKEAVQNMMGDEVTVTITSIRKNNGITLDGMLIARKERGISPAYYVNNQYQAMLEGKAIAAIAEEIVDLYERSDFPHQLNLEFFNSAEEMKSNVLYKLIHFQKNRELLNDLPHLRFMDLAIVFFCNLSEEYFENGSVLIHNRHVERWNLTAEELYQSAQLNTMRLCPETIIDMEEVMRGVFIRRLKDKIGTDEGGEELLKRFMEEQYPNLAEKEFKQAKGRYKMYVLGNEDRLFGAAAMLYPGVLDRFSDEMGLGLFLLPSSVHEIIIVPDDGSMDKDELQQIVSEINDNHVDPEEVLGYTIYYYDRHSKEILQV